MDEAWRARFLPLRRMSVHMVIVKNTEDVTHVHYADKWHNDKNANTVMIHLFANKPARSFCQHPHVFPFIRQFRFPGTETNVAQHREKCTQVSGLTRQ